MADPAAAGPRTEEPVTIVTQTRVRPEFERQFAAWQDRIGGVIATQPGFLESRVMPPTPPQQVDWVILQRFESTANAVAWLNSAERLALLNEAAPYLVGNDDVHFVRDGQSGGLSAPITAVIATRIKPGMEEAYRKWERRIAAAQANAAGFQGYRFELPIPGVQDDFLAIVRFDTEEHLNAWLASPERAQLLEEGAPLTDEFHARVVRTGFEQWFPSASTGAPPPAWKQNMVVLLMLYPVVFLFGFVVHGPLLIGKLGLPFAVALFFGNVASVLLLNYLVPWASGRFGWWLQDRGDPTVDVRGIAILIALYVALIAVFYAMG